MADDALSRRSFSAMTAATGAVAAAGPALAKAKEVVETNVTYASPDGTVDAVFFHPKGRGSWPGVVMLADAMGLRPVFRDMGRRMAAEGYAVIVPNPYYRTRKAPVFDATFDFTNPTDRAKLGPMRAPLTQEGANRDVRAHIGFLDAQKVVNKRKGVGVQGYCMGGTMTINAAIDNPARIKAAGSFHGGGLATDRPDSPHLGVPKIAADVLIAIADNDDKRDPAVKDTLRAAFDAANKPAKIEVYTGADHGWCVKGSAVYNEPAAEKAWAELLTVYRRALG